MPQIFEVVLEPRVAVAVDMGHDGEGLALIASSLVGTVRPAMPGRADRAHHIAACSFQSSRSHAHAQESQGVIRRRRAGAEVRTLLLAVQDGALIFVCILRLFER